MALPGAKKGHRRLLSNESILSASSVGSIDDRGARAKWGSELGGCLYGCVRCQCCRDLCKREEGEEHEGCCSACSRETKADEDSALWRHELGEWLEEPIVYRPITALLLIDVAFIFAEFIIHDYHFIDEWWPHEVAYYIKCTSLSILVIFQIESILTLTAFGLKFFMHPGFVLDAIVIPVSILMETVVSNDAAALLVLLRFWRLVRIAHGIYEAQMVQLRQTQQELMKHKIVITHQAPHLHTHIKHFEKKYNGGLTDSEKLGISTKRMENNPFGDMNGNENSVKSMGNQDGELETAELSETDGPEKGNPSPGVKRGTAKSRTAATELTAVPSTNTTE